MPQQDSRGWLQYGLRTLVAVMLVAALFFGYTAWWMRRLQEAEGRAEAAAQQAEDERRRAQVALEMAEAARLEAQVAMAQEQLARQRAESIANLAAAARAGQQSSAETREQPDDGRSDDGP